MLERKFPYFLIPKSIHPNCYKRLLLLETEPQIAHNLLICIIKLYISHHFGRDMYHKRNTLFKNKYRNFPLKNRFVNFTKRFIIFAIFRLPSFYFNLLTNLSRHTFWCTILCSVRVLLFFLVLMLV